MIRTFIRDNRRYAATSDHNSKRSPRRPGKSYDAAEQQNLRQTISLLGVPTGGRGTRTRDHQCFFSWHNASKNLLSRMAIRKTNASHQKKVLDNPRIQSILQTISFIFMTLHKDKVVLTERRNHMKRTYTVVFGALMLTLLLPLVASAQGRKTDPDLVRARQLFFGAENVDPHSGRVRHDKVIFSWFTNSSYAVSLKGRIILLDSYVHRAETVPGRTPLVVEDLVSLRPEAIFLGHGHGDHADNAAFVAGTLGIPIYSLQETCMAMQQDAMNLFNSGVIQFPTMDCRDVTTTDSTAV